ncbi:HlyD family efflux transporter periplasmic adaptor subunit [Endozoicomonadaceae bacterium StTr2]
MPRPLFRKEVYRQPHRRALGQVICIIPPGALFWCCTLFSMALLLVLFLAAGKYSHKTNVNGVLVPRQGSVRVTSRTAGLVQVVSMGPGLKVKKDDVLYRVITEEFSGRSESFVHNQINSLQQEIQHQQKVLALSQDELQQLQQLLGEHYLSRIEYDRKRKEVLYQQLELADLKKDLAAVQERQGYVVRSPVDGTVASVIVPADQYIAPGQVLAVLTPDDSALQGYLFVPARSIGFIQTGDEIRLKYAAFPYEKFGLYPARIVTIDQTILLPGDISQPNTPPEPFYRITVEPEQHYVEAYGRRIELISGMLLEALVVSESRYLWEWVLDPLLSLKGSLE